jgi:hypothetical protein
MRLAAGGAAVAVNRSTKVNKTKNIPIERKLLLFCIKARTTDSKFKLCTVKHTFENLLLDLRNNRQVSVQPIIIDVLK